MVSLAWVPVIICFLFADAQLKNVLARGGDNAHAAEMFQLAFAWREGRVRRPLPTFLPGMYPGK